MVLDGQLVKAKFTAKAFKTVSVRAPEQVGF